MDKLDYTPYRKTLNLALQAREEENTYAVEDTIFLESTPYYDQQLGQVGGVQVLNLEKSPNGYILHLAGPAKNNLQEIDWQKRLRFMQLSLGRVLYSLAFNHLLNISTLDYHIHDQYGKIVLDAQDIPFRSLDQVESLVNYTVLANLLVHQTKIDNGVLVRVGDYPLQKSMGPHLVRTGEVGENRIFDLKKVDQGIEISFVSGQLAHENYMDLAKTMDNLAQILNCPVDKVPSKVKQLLLKKDHYRSEVKKSEKSKQNDLAQKLMAQASDFKGVKVIYKSISDIPFSDLKEASAQIMDQDDYLQLYGLPSSDLSQFLICLSKNRNEDLKEIYDRLKDAYKLEGGGNYLRVQGNVQTKYLPELMEKFLIRFQAKIKQ